VIGSTTEEERRLKARELTECSVALSSWKVELRYYVRSQPKWPPARGAVTKKVDEAAATEFRIPSRSSGQVSRAKLPYGPVMATGAASQLAGLSGLHAAVAPLLWLTVAEAVWIAAVGIGRDRGALVRSWLTAREPGEHAGALTVPLGLAVTTTGLAAQHGAFDSSLALAGLVLTWLSLLVLVFRFVASVITGGKGLAALDGSWFLAPAVLLGGAIAAVASIPHVAGAEQAVLRGLAVVAAVGGLAGYWAFLAWAIGRVSRHGLGKGRVLWWISAGCGGLAAAATAKVLGVPGGHWAVAFAGGLRTAMAITLIMAAILLVPIVVQSARFLARKRPVIRNVPWPPAFSSSVMALGTIGTGVALPMPVIITAGKGAGIAALIIWTVTACWNAAVLVLGSRSGPEPHTRAWTSRT
jgi:hypothetical protein